MEARERESQTRLVLDETGEQLGVNAIKDGQQHGRAHLRVAQHGGILHQLVNAEVKEPLHGASRTRNRHGGLSAKLVILLRLEELALAKGRLGPLAWQRWGYGPRPLDRSSRCRGGSSRSSAFRAEEYDIFS